MPIRVKSFPPAAPYPLATVLPLQPDRRKSTYDNSSTVT